MCTTTNYQYSFFFQTLVIRFVEDYFIHNLNLASKNPYAVLWSLSNTQLTLFFTKVQEPPCISFETENKRAHCPILYLFWNLIYFRNSTPDCYIEGTIFPCWITTLRLFIGQKISIRLEFRRVISEHLHNFAPAVNNLFYSSATYTVCMKIRLIENTRLFGGTSFKFSLVSFILPAILVNEGLFKGNKEHLCSFWEFYTDRISLYNV